MSFHIYFDDNNIRVYFIKYVFRGNRNSRGSNHLLPFILPTVEVLLGDKVGGPGHVVVLSLQVGVQLLPWLVTGGEDLNICVLWYTVIYLIEL